MINFIKITKKKPLQINERVISCKKTVIPIVSIQNAVITQDTKAISQSLRKFKNLGVLFIVLGGIAAVGTFLIYGWIWLEFGGWNPDFSSVTFGGFLDKTVRLRDTVLESTVVTVNVGVLDLFAVNTLISLHQKATNSWGLKISSGSNSYFFSSNNLDDLENMLDLILRRKEEMAENLTPSYKSYVISGDGTVVGDGIIMDKSSIKISKGDTDSGNTKTTGGYDFSILAEFFNIK